MSHRFHPSILREYDIRGIVGDTLHAAAAEAIGRAFGTLVVEAGGRMVCAGRDGRLSSPELEAALVRGLLACGLEVNRIGLGPTPQLYYACHNLKADGGIMVTGSHNPPNHNGFKMVLGGKPFFAEQIQRLGRIAESGAYRQAADGAGKVVDVEIQERYIDRLLADLEGDAPLTVVWDSGNGATGEAVEALTKRLPGRHILLNTVIDGTFPAHHPDPTEPENMEQLRHAVLSEKADFGIAFDGDGDRLGVVDSQGRILWGDQMLLLLVEGVLKAQPGAIVLADVKSSQILFDHISALGGRPEMCRTGHSIIKTRMAETGAALAGEMSGHIFFADRYYGYDDALYAAVRFFSMVRLWDGITLDQRYDGLPRLFNTPELRIDCAEDKKRAVINGVKAALAGTSDRVIDIDGIRVNTADGWWLLRASNTQAVLVARCEATTPEGLARLIGKITKMLKFYSLTINVKV
jgi:phosphomannomutase